MTDDRAGGADRPGVTDDRLSAYLDGELDPDEVAEVEAMVAGSSQRERELAAVAEVRDLLRALPPVEPEVTPLRRPSGPTTPPGRGSRRERRSAP